MAGVINGVVRTPVFWVASVYLPQGAGLSTVAIAFGRTREGETRYGSEISTFGRSFVKFASRLGEVAKR